MLSPHGCAPNHPLTAASEPLDWSQHLQVCSVFLPSISALFLPLVHSVSFCDMIPGNSTNIGSVAPPRQKRFVIFFLTEMQRCAFKLFPQIKNWWTGGAEEASLGFIFTLRPRAALSQTPALKFSQTCWSGAGLLLGINCNRPINRPELKPRLGNVPLRYVRPLYKTHAYFKGVKPLFESEGVDVGWACVT